ncbi:MAG: DUF1934 domain-containing protein [Clostridia bacterium]|nr:DUF1934 domain-containing protein [Clostridia bacterium]
MTNVLIEIKGIQKYAEGHDDETVFTTNGTLSYENSVLTLCYDESEMIGAKGVSTQLVLENGNKMTLIRRGGMESRMTVEKGRRHSCLYNTPEGDFVIGIFGEELMFETNKRGGKIYMSYTLDVNSGLLSKNIMEIKFEEIKNV